MKIRKSLLVALVLVLSLGLIPSLVSAAPIILNPDGTKSQTVAGVTITTPQTYSYCTNEPTSDQVVITNANGYRVVGDVIVQYVTPTGRVVIDTYSVDTTGSTVVNIVYPAPSLWPYADAGQTTREIHVDIQFVVFVGNTFYNLGGADPGDPNQEGLGWDVFCVGGDFPPPPPPPDDNYGCTPGYWKNHTERWASLTGTPLVSLYPASASYGLGSNTLLQSLRYGGGRGTLGAAYILLRASAAAYLNSLPVYGLNYPLTTAQITSRVNAALASNDRGTILGLATELDIFNNFGCPLN